MNRGQVVKAEGHEKGAVLRVWVDDEEGHHLTVCEVPLSVKLLAAIVVDVERAQQRSEQYQFAFDD